MASVDKIAALPDTLLNIDVSNLPAVAKSGERKNTQVTFMKKKVTSAIAKFEVGMLFKKRGACNPLTAI